MSNEEKNMILDFGALGYSKEKCAKILGTSIDDLTEEFETTYERGKLLSDYKIDAKVLEMAHQGDMKALQRLEIKKKRG